MLDSSSNLIQSKTQSKISYKHQTRAQTQTQTPSLLSFAKFPQPDFASAIAFGATVSARSNFYNTRKDFRIPYSGFSPSIEMASSSSLYEILGIPISASGNEIKAAYRRLARMCHPDVVSFNQKDTSANEFMKIHEAYSTLSDPDKRANYDQDLFRRSRPFGSSPSPSSSYRSSTMAAAAASMSRFSSYSSKKWETDQCW